jgi:hypothetical protein
MTAPRTRVAPPPIPIQAETDFVASVETIAAIMNREAKRLALKQAAGTPLNEVDTRVLANLSLTAKSLQSGTLWGARAILVKQQKAEPEKK